MAELGPVTIENATIIYRNFAGKEGQFNAAGDRNFCVILDKQTAEAMVKDGWNVKFPNPRDEDEEARDPYLPVKVSYKQRPPKIVMLTNEGKTRTNLDEQSVELLDWADIQNVDLIVNPYAWELASGKSGIKAYLKTMFVTIHEDDLERKYAEYDG